MDEIVDKQNEISCDVLVIGGGTAGPMAALKAKLADPKATVILLEKANVKRSGAISMGMDGLNNRASSRSASTTSTDMWRRPISRHPVAMMAVLAFGPSLQGCRLASRNSAL